MNSHIYLLFYSSLRLNKSYWKIIPCNPREFCQRGYNAGSNGQQHKGANQGLQDWRQPGGVGGVFSPKEYESGKD